MSKKEQVQPLSPAVHLINFDNDDDFHEELNQHPHRKYVKWCGCITALLLLLVVILLVLIFTVFWVKTPILRINSIRIEGLDRVNWTNVSPDTNLTVFADVSVKNPNMASFKYNNATTGLYYEGILIGEARTPPGSAPARRTRMINVTIDVMVKNIMDVPRLQDDFIAGVLPLSSYTRISGTVKFLDILKRSAVLRSSCTMKANLTTHLIQDRSCKRQLTI